ncbi:hypothetical protein ACH0C8_13200 [Acetobacter lovaniensis]
MRVVRAMPGVARISGPSHRVHGLVGHAGLCHTPLRRKRGGESRA